MPHFRVPVQERCGCSGAALAQCAQGAALNAGLVQQVKSRRKRARGDPTAACSHSLCGNRGDRAGLGVWQQDRSGGHELELGKSSFHAWKDFFNLSD